MSLRVRATVCDPCAIEMDSFFGSGAATFLRHTRCKTATCKRNITHATHQPHKHRLTAQTEIKLFFNTTRTSTHTHTYIHAHTLVPKAQETVCPFSKVDGLAHFLCSGGPFNRVSVLQLPSLGPFFSNFAPQARRAFL